MSAKYETWKHALARKLGKDSAASEKQGWIILGPYGNVWSTRVFDEPEQAVRYLLSDDGFGRYATTWLALKSRGFSVVLGSTTTSATIVARSWEPGEDGSLPSSPEVAYVGQWDERHSELTEEEKA